MAIQFFPAPNGISTTASPPSSTYKYRLIGTASENEANAYVMASTPFIVTTTYGVLYRQDIECQRTAYNQWDVTVPYDQTNRTLGEWTWDFDTTGGQIHITNAKEEVSRYPATTAPNQLGAIACDGDEVKGTEIIVPAMKVNVQFKHPMGVVTLAYAKFLSNITGTVNSDRFLGFSPGEVLFLGASGSDGTNAEASMNYSFAMSANVTGLSIGAITGVAKKGWEVAWIRYHDTITSADGKDNPTRVAKYVYVDRVYEEINMTNALGFGGV